MLTTKQESTLLAAMSLNNRGVALLEKQEYKRAILHFSNGLKLSQKLTKNAVGCKSSGVPLDSCMSSRDCKVGTNSPRVGKSAFLRPITIQLEQATSPSAFIRTLPSIFTFNQSIAHHLVGLSSRSTRYMQKATKLYECSLAGIAHNNLGATSTVCVCACLNNMAGLYRFLRQPKQSKRCLRHLLSTLMLLTNDNHGWPQNLNIFFSSVASLMGSRIAAAAA